MNPDRVRRDRLDDLTDLPNVGPRIASALRGIGIDRPLDLVGRDAFALYRALCRKTGERQDPCVLDVLISITRFADGGEARPWWHFTAERKREHPDL